MRAFLAIILFFCLTFMWHSYISKATYALTNSTATDKLNTLSAPLLQPERLHAQGRIRGCILERERPPAYLLNVFLPKDDEIHRMADLELKKCAEAYLSDAPTVEETKVRLDILKRISLVE